MEQFLSFFGEYPRSFGATIVVIIHVLGILAAIDAVFSTRSSQAAIAWAISLFLFPFGVLPLYLVFGRLRFYGYKRILKRMAKVRRSYLQERQSAAVGHKDDSASLRDQGRYALENIAGTFFTTGNRVALLTDGQQFFDSLFKRIRAAKSHIYLCFYLLRDDQIGQSLKQELIAAAARGVKVWFLYDQLGSILLSKKYVRELIAGGVEAVNFETRKGWWNLFQLNFRNHRKIVVIDSTTASVGGFNVGDEYLGRSKDLGYWRDTQIEIEGPAVRDIELVFLADWAWALQSFPNIARQKSLQACGGASVLTTATGATEEKNRCLLTFLELFSQAESRLWISTPYFVPDEALLQALNLCAMRGVDVRLIVPQRSDNILVDFAALFYLTQVAEHGVKIYRYTKGVLHGKAVLVDDKLLTVGSANLDNRSLRLNFEIMVTASDPALLAEGSAMFEKDFSNSRLLKDSELKNLPWYSRIASNVAKLLSPVL